MKVDDNRRKIYIYPKDSFLEFKKEGLNSRSKNKIIDHKDYKIIVAKFIRIWLFNFLCSKGYYYFPFMGYVAKYKTNELFVRDRSTKKIAEMNVFKKINPTVGIFWRFIPNEKNGVLFIKKRDCSYTQMFKDWMELNNVNELLTLKERKKEGEMYIKNNKI